MTKEDLAAALDGVDIGGAISRKMAEAARKAGLVIVHGASDDLMEFRGAIEDEIGAREGATAIVDAEGLIPDFEDVDKDDKDALRAYFRREGGGRKIEAVWYETGDGPAWTYETDIPHATFTIMEDGEVWCRGIVFALADLDKAEITVEDAGHE